MKNRYSLTAVIASVVLGLAACGGTDDTAAPGSDADESLAAPMQEAIQKAEAVEDQVMEHKEAIDEALEASDEEDASDGE